MHVSWRGSHTWIVVAAMAGTWLQPWRVFGIASIFLALFELTFLYGCVMVGAMLLILIIRGRDEFNQVRVDHMARYVKLFYMLQILIASSADTITVMLTWTLYLLLNKPHALMYTQEELDNIVRLLSLYVAAALFPVSGVVLVVELLMLLMTAVVICLITDDVTADLRRTRAFHHTGVADGVVYVEGRRHGVSSNCQGKYNRRT
ncbi:cytochrome P450 CYP82D47-like protein [Tanacetum coccineum]